MDTKGFCTQYNDSDLQKPLEKTLSDTQAFLTQAFCTEGYYSSKDSYTTLCKPYYAFCEYLTKAFCKSYAKTTTTDKAFYMIFLSVKEGVRKGDSQL